MDDLLKPPTAIEVAELLGAVKHEAHGVGLMVLRRLASHRDRQTIELAALKKQNTKLREALEGLLLYVDAKNKVLVAYRLGSHAIVNRALNSLAKLGNKKAKAREALGVI